jgi:Rieske 2Fe-2S family protein
VCPYHGWVYDLNGSLRSAPKVGDVAAFEPTLLGLTELPSREWGGWIWVNAAGAASPLEQVHLPFHEIATRYRPEGLAVGSVHRYELAANWKLVHENYQECYHCPLIHPELSRVTVANSGDNLRAPAGAVVGGSMQLVADTMSFSGRSPLRRLPAVAERGADDPAGQEVWYLSVFPSLLVAFHPDYVLTHRLEPVAPDRTIVECTWLFDPDAMAQPEFDPGFAVDFWDVVNRQDWAAIESVQRSMGSPHFRPGIIGHSEDAVWQFETLVAAGYLGRNLVPLPLPSSYRR